MTGGRIKLMAGIAAMAVLILATGCGARLKPVEDGVYYVEGDPGVSNQLVLVTGYGPVIADARLDPYLTDDLNKTIRQITGWEEAAYVINTSGLPYRWLSNYRFAKAEIVASTKTHRFMADHSPEFLTELTAMKNLPAWANEVNPVFPTMDFEKKLVLRTPEFRVMIIELPAGVAPGNSVVYVAEKQLLYGGDIVTSGTAPTLRYADPAGWLEGLASLQRMPVHTVVPGFGKLGSASLIDDNIAAVKALEVYRGGPVPGAITNLWPEDTDLKRKLNDYVVVKQTEEAIREGGGH